MMKRNHFFPLLTIGIITLSASTCGVQSQVATVTDTPVVEVPSTPDPDPSAPTVYFTSDISASGLVNVYEALGIAPAEGQRVAITFTAVFSDMKITECMWKAHEGQQPDE